MEREPLLRVARPTNDLERLARMYERGLELDVLARFEDHDGFDGVVLGMADGRYQIELTRCAHERAGRAPSRDHLLGFEDPDGYRVVIRNAEWRSPGD